MTGRAGVNDAKGRRVCGDCIEAARQLVARRESRKRQVEALRKSETELSRVEHDNSAVLSMSEDEVLALARFACTNCGRVLPVAGAGCEACGFGTSLGVPTRRKSRLRLNFRTATSQSSTLFPQLDPRIVMWSGTAMITLGGLTPVVALLVGWMWEGAILITLGLTLAALALLGFARRHALPSLTVHAIGSIIAMTLLVRGISGANSQPLGVWLAGGAVALSMQGWTLVSNADDWLVRRAVAGSVLAQTGMIALAVIRTAQVA